MLLRLQFQQIQIQQQNFKERTLEDYGDGPMATYRKFLDGFINVASTNRGSRAVHHSVATYEQTKKGLSYFHPKKNVDADAIYTRPLNL